MFLRTLSIVLLGFTLNLPLYALAEQQFADEPLAVKTKPVPPNVMLLLSRGSTMNGQLASPVGGADVYYAPGYDPDIRYECPKNPVGWSYNLLAADNSKTLVAYMATADGLAGVDSPHRITPGNTADRQAPAGVPFFQYGSDFFVFGNNIHKGKLLRGENINGTPVCFDPDANYRVKLWANEPLNVRTTVGGGKVGDIYRTYAGNSNEEVVSGSFLNWYYSDVPSKWADETVNGGLGYTPSEQKYVVANPDYNFTRRGGAGIIDTGNNQWGDAGSCALRKPVTDGGLNVQRYQVAPATVDGRVTLPSVFDSTTYSFTSNGCYLNTTVKSGLPSGTPTNSIGMKRGVTYIGERWSVARDVIKKVVRDASNINLALATYTKKWTGPIQDGDRVLRLESDFQYFSGDNEDSTQKANKEKLLRNINTLTATPVDNYRAPAGSAALAAANLMFKGLNLNHFGNNTFNVAGQRGGEGASKSLEHFEKNWCQKNAIVLLTDDTATGEANLLTGDMSNWNTKPSGVDESKYNDLINNHNQSSKKEHLIDTCPQCENNLIKVLGKLYDTDWLSEEVSGIDVRGKQNIETYIIGFGSTDLLDKDALILAGQAGGGGKDNFYLAKDGNQISKAFNDIMARVKSEAVSLTAVAASTVPDRNISNLDEAYAVQATYDTEYWTGELSAFKMTVDGELVDAKNPNIKSNTSAGITPYWKAGEVMNKQFLLPKSALYQTGGVKARNVYSYNKKGIRFGGIGMDENNANTFFNKLTQKMRDDIDRMAQGEQKGRYDLMMYLLGDISNEEAYPGQTSSKPLRNRGVYMDYDEDGKIDRIISGGMLGDITNSSPVYVKEPARKWKEPGYADYYEKNKDRAAMIYVGTNRGFLHGFTVEGDSSGRYPAGAERFAYMPSMLANDEPLGDEAGNSGFAYLANQRYEHKFMVDLTPTVSDVYMDFYTDVESGHEADPEWRTILVGGLRSGGRGIFALDVTCPFQTNNTGSTCDDESFNERNVLWEFTAEDDNDLGYTFSQPIIAKVNYDLPNSSATERNGNGNGRWAAIIPNGYHSETGRAALFILFLDGGLDGTWTAGKDYVKILVGDGSEDNVNSKNGLSEPVAVDLDDDGIIDHIYAGDLKGQMWTFDVRTNILYEE